MVHRYDPFNVALSKPATKASKIFESVQSISESSAFDFDPELMSLSLVVEVGQILQHNSNTTTTTATTPTPAATSTATESLTVVPYIEHLLELINNANAFSLTNIQVQNL